MRKRVSRVERQVLGAIVANGGVGVGTYQINRHLGGGPYVPIFFALGHLEDRGYVQSLPAGQGRDGVTIVGWSLTPTGRKVLAAPRWPGLLLRFQ